MGKISPLPWQLAWRSFTIAEARKAGLTPGRVRGRDLLVPGRGIRTPVQAPENLLETCRAFTASSPNSVISHATAARLHKLYLPLRLSHCPGLDLSRRFGEPQPRRAGVRGHLLMFGDGDIVLVQGVPVTSVQRTLVDLAPLLSIDELVDLADQIVCQHHRSFGFQKYPMLPLPELQAYVSLHAGARGIKRLRTAMELVRVGSDSPPETRLRLLIMRSPLPNFETNVEILDRTGRGKVAPDLACKKYRTCAEYDGAHHFTPEQQSRDHDRDYLTRSLGWHQALINKDDMKIGERVVVTKIARMLVLGGWPDPQDLARRSLGGLLNTRKDAE